MGGGQFMGTGAGAGVWGGDVRGSKGSRCGAGGKVGEGTGEGVMASSPIPLPPHPLSLCDRRRDLVLFYKKTMLSCV